MEGTDDRSFPEANVHAVRSLAGAVVTTLGPVPRDKLIVGGDDGEDVGHLPGVRETADVVVSSDATTILENLDLDHPIAPVVRRMSGPERPGETDVEGEDIPDGMTTTLVLTAGLLDEAMTLVYHGLHPTSIRRGYHAALQTALETVDELAAPAADRDDLVDVARTAMTGNDVGGQRARWAEFAVDAVEAVGAPGPKTFAVRSFRRGSVADSRLIRGAVLDRNTITDDGMPRRVDDATVLVLDGQDEGGLRGLELDRDYTVAASTPETVAGFQDVDAERRERIVEKLVALDVDVVVAKQGIETAYASELARRGIVGIDGVTRLYLGQVAKATGATPIKRTEDFDADALGRAGTVAEHRHETVGGDDARFVVFDDCPAPASVCALLYGVWGPLADGAATDLRKAAAAVAAARGEAGRRPGVVPGGGATEARVAAAVRDHAAGVDNRAQLAFDAFADAVDTVVFSLAKNGGMDPLATRPDLRAKNAAEASPHGLRLPDGEVVDAAAAGILDPLDVHRRCYVTAVEVASLLVGIDDAVPVDPPEPAPDPGDAIYEDAAEQQQSYLDDNDDTRWDG